MKTAAVSGSDGSRVATRSSRSTPCARSTFAKRFEVSWSSPKQIAALAAPASPPTPSRAGRGRACRRRRGRCCSARAPPSGGARTSPRSCRARTCGSVIAGARLPRVRRFLAPAVLVVALLVPAELAGACSCARSSTRAASSRRQRRRSSDGSWRRRSSATTRSAVGEVYRYRIRVGRSLKRRLGRRIKLRQHTQSAACGFEWNEGQRVAAYLYGRRGQLDRPAPARSNARASCGASRARLAQESVSRPRPPRSPRSTCR